MLVFSPYPSRKVVEKYHSFRVTEEICCTRLIELSPILGYLDRRWDKYDMFMQNISTNLNIYALLEIFTFGENRCNSRFTEHSCQVMDCRCSQDTIMNCSM